MNTHTLKGRDEQNTASVTAISYSLNIQHEKMQKCVYEITRVLCL